MRSCEDLQPLVQSSFASHQGGKRLRGTAWAMGFSTGNGKKRILNFRGGLKGDLGRGNAVTLSAECCCTVVGRGSSVNVGNSEGCQSLDPGTTLNPVLLRMGK